MGAQQHDSPYLETSTPGAVIPLKSSKTEVQIAGVIAHVQQTQVYHNTGTFPIEAKYVFPLSIQAAVHKMQMTIGDRTINATIFEKQEAQQVYTAAVNEGKHAAKLDQTRPNVFQMNLGNIMPGDQIAIEVFYTELLVPVHGAYQFVAPGVVGPRFVEENTKSKEAFQMPYHKNSDTELIDFDLKVFINAGMIIQNIASASHQINVRYPDSKTGEVFLSKNNANPSNRDFILNYNLRGNAIQSGLLLYEHEDEKFFAYTMEPQAKKTIKQNAIPSREYLFIVDVSGSMNGYPLDVSKELMRNLLCNLAITDTFNVQLFASSSTVFNATPVPANGENIAAAIRFLSNGQGGGGTRLINALQTAYQLPRMDPGSARSMVIITDGYVSVEKEAFQLIKEHLDEANVFTFGIGSSVNRYLLEGMAKVAQSESFIATTHSEASRVAKEFKEYIATPLLTQIQLKAKGFEIYDVAPQSIPDVFSARPVVVYGKYRGKPEGSLVITGYQGKNKFRQIYQVADGILSKQNKALRYLWARKRIEELDDYRTLFSENVKEKVIELGLQYNLVTNYTSFVAVDQKVVNKDGSPKTIKQPLPLSRNVGSLAVGAAASVTGVSKTTNSYTATIVTPQKITKMQKRNITMGFNVLYTKLLQRYLKNYATLRIKFNAKGVLQSVEIQENGKWVLAKELLAPFSKVNTNKLGVSNGITIEVKR